MLAWYDNEWGYVNRMVELARKVRVSRPTQAPDGRADVEDGMATADALRPRGDLRNYVLVTAAYWADTLTDGATADAGALLLPPARLLGPIAVAMLFLFYEFFGIVTNLVGGWMASRLGLKATLFAGLGLRSSPLSMLALRPRVPGSRALRHGGAGALGHRQGPDQDELQERHQAASCPRRRRSTLCSSGWPS